MLLGFFWKILVDNGKGGEYNAAMAAEAPQFIADLIVDITPRYEEAKVERELGIQLLTRARDVLTAKGKARPGFNFFRVNGAGGQEWHLRETEPAEVKHNGNNFSFRLAEFQDGDDIDPASEPSVKVELGLQEVDGNYSYIPLWSVRDYKDSKGQSYPSVRDVYNNRSQARLGEVRTFLKLIDFIDASLPNPQAATVSSQI